jgi:hypothetical protein
LIENSSTIVKFAEPHTWFGVVRGINIEVWEDSSSHTSDNAYSQYVNICAHRLVGGEILRKMIILVTAAVLLVVVIAAVLLVGNQPFQSNTNPSVTNPSETPPDNSGESNTSGSSNEPTEGSQTVSSGKLFTVTISDMFLRNVKYLQSNGYTANTLGKALIIILSVTVDTNAVDGYQPKIDWAGCMQKIYRKSALGTFDPSSVSNPYVSTWSTSLECDHVPSDIYRMDYTIEFVPLYWDGSIDGYPWSKERGSTFALPPLNDSGLELWFFCDISLKNKQTGEMVNPFDLLGYHEGDFETPLATMIDLPVLNTLPLRTTYYELKSRYVT